MRGILIEIATIPDKLGNLTADQFAKTNDGASFANWYDDATSTNAFVKFISDMELYGVKHEVEYSNAVTGEYHCLIFDTEAKEKYFKHRYKTLKKEIKSFSLQAFASNEVGFLQKLIEDDSSDAVYLTEEDHAINLDTFIRHAEPEQKYYIGNIVMMH